MQTEEWDSTAFQQESIACSVHLKNVVGARIRRESHGNTFGTSYIVGVILKTQSSSTEN